MEMLDLSNSIFPSYYTDYDSPTVAFSSGHPSSGRGRRGPVATYNTKYCAKGGFSIWALANVRGPQELVRTLADMLNYGVATNTW